LAGVFATLLLWTVGYGLELASVSLPAKLFWANLQFIGLLAMPVLWLGVMRKALGKPALPGWFWALLSSVSVALMAIVYLNPDHLLRKRPTIVASPHLGLVSAHYGPLFYSLCVPFSLVLLGVSLVGFAQAASRGLPLYRARAALLLAAMLLPVVGGALYMAGALPWREFNPASATLSVAAVLCALALLRYRVFDVAPLAREALVDQLADGIIVINDRGLLIDFNPVAATILPELEISALGSPVCGVLRTRTDLTAALFDREPAAATEDPPVVAIDAPAPDGGLRRRHFSLVRTPLRDTGGRALGDALVLHDLTRRVELFSKIERLATIDELTGLLTRRQLTALAERELARARRQRLPITVLLFDLDNFKAVNDRHWHATGDEVLRAVATTCRAELRTADLLGRYGGDEFCAVLPDLGESDACLIAERLRAAIAELGVWREQVLVHTSASIGVVGCDRVTDETMAGLVHAADAALYRAKRAGGDRVALASESGGLDGARDGRAAPSALASTGD
jgi:diguanylate cyclase (GGDEF)-like protein